MVWQNQDSSELDQMMGFWGNRHSKMQKKSAGSFFGNFESPLWIYELL